MRFYGEIKRVSSDDERVVEGYASTTVKAADGMTITADALRGALDEYMRFANIREMHRLSAVGVTREAEVDDNGLYIAAWIQDDDAWDKVKTGVYRGFSIGAKATARDPGDQNVVTGLLLNEISLVDRPADPGAVFDVFRAADSEEDDMKDKKTAPAASAAALDAAGALAPATDIVRTDAHVAPATLEGAAATEAPVLEAPAQAAVEVERTEEAPVVETAETEQSAAPAPEEVEDPVTRALAAASAAHAGLAKAFDVERAESPRVIAILAPGLEIRRGMDTVHQTAWLLSELVYIVQDVQFEAILEGDGSTVPAQLRAALAELAKAYRALSDEELGELLKNVDVDISLEAGIIQLAAYGSDIERASAHQISDETGVRLQAALDGVIARGFKPKVDKAVDVLIAQRDQLTRTVEELSADVLKRAQQFEDFRAENDARLKAIEAQPMPAKTAGAHVERAATAATSVGVDKGADAAGVATAAPALSDDDVRRALEGMDPQERSMVLTRAALARPYPITR